MSEEENKPAEDQNTPQPQPEPTPEPAKAKADPEHKPDPKTDDDPSWLPDRLNRERKKVLAELGIDPDQVGEFKEAIQAHREQQEAQKSEVQKLTEDNTRLKAKAERVDQLQETVANMAASKLEKLSDAQKAAVTALAGEDPAKVLGAINALEPTWARKPEQEVKKDTAPAANAPADTGSNVSETDHKARYSELKETNPIAAANYLAQHQDDIFPRTA